MLIERKNEQKKERFRMKEKIKELVEKYDIRDLKDGRIQVDSSIARNQADVNFVKSNKPAIIQYLRDEAQKRLEQEEKENREKYAELFAQLPERKIENTPDEQKFTEIMSRKEYRNYDGPEDEGLRIAQNASNNRIAHEAMQYCNHELETKYRYDMTQDARLKLVREISCKRCGLYIRDIVEEHREYNWN